MTWVVIGLGNPGPEYASTRHNVGQMVVDELARRVGARLSIQRKLNAQVASTRIGGAQGQPAVLAKPLTYMNLSGGPTSLVARYYNADPAHVVVVHDELDIPFGAIRLKLGGGAAGHNGLRDITKALGTPDFPRVRVGIGRPPGRQDAADYVLKPFGSTERKELDLHIALAADAVEDLVLNGLAAAQQRFHTGPAT